MRAIGVGACLLLVGLFAVPAAEAVAPVLPGCAPTSSHVSTTAGLPATAPDNGGAANPLTRTLAVAGLDEGIVDVDVNVTIAHTFPSDMDLYLVSPEGTEVTLSTDNAGSNDNVFRGTLFDDQADPGSFVNATDYPYILGVVAPTLTPEEPLSALDGENPNGVWTLRVEDDVAGEAPTLEAWSLTITAGAGTGVPITTTLVVSNATAHAIPDNNSAGATSTNTLAGVTGRVWHVEVATALQHPVPSQLDVELISPSGKVQTLTTDNGGANADVFRGTFWTASAGETNPPGPVTDSAFAAPTPESPVAPEEAGEAFKGDNPNGTWTLRAADDTAGSTGVLEGWSLVVTHGACTAADLTAGVSAAPAEVTTGGTTAYVATARNRGPAAAASVNLSASLPGGATLLAATPTQGTCTGTSCDLGPLPGGDEAQVVFLVRQGQAGAAPLTATVATTTPELSTANNSATASTNVVDPPPNVVDPPPAAGSSAGDGTPAGGSSNAVALDPPPVLVALAGTPPKLRVALRRGLTTLVACTEACSITGELRVDRSTVRRYKLKSATVGTGAARLGAAGAGKLKLKFTSEARKKLAKARSIKLVLSGVATDSAGQQGTATTKLGLKR